VGCCECGDEPSGSGPTELVCHSEGRAIGSARVRPAERVFWMQTGKDSHPHPQTGKTWSVLKQ
jgi:hypothetical protein